MKLSVIDCFIKIICRICPSPERWLFISFWRHDVWSHPSTMQVTILNSYSFSGFSKSLQRLVRLHPSPPDVASPSFPLLLLSESSPCGHFTIISTTNSLTMKLGTDPVFTCTRQLGHFFACQAVRRALVAECVPALFDCLKAVEGDGADATAGRRCCEYVDWVPHDVELCRDGFGLVGWVWRKLVGKARPKIWR